MRPYRKILRVTGTGAAGWRQYLGLPAQGFSDAEAEEELLRPLLAVDELFCAPQVPGAVLQEVPDYDERTRCSLVMSLRISHALPRPVSVLRQGIFLHAAGEGGILKIPVYDGFLRYYYPDYENYWYFPAEDMAVHKNLALYSDRSHREKATIDTAYTKVAVRTAASWGEKERRDYCLNILQHLKA